jgi:hypothetical protein
MPTVGNIYELDLGDLSPTVVKVISFDDNEVSVEYLHSYPGRIETFTRQD